MVGVTAARKVEEQVSLLERRGAKVVWAPALSLNPNHVDDESLRAATADVLSRPIDLFLATTGIGMKAWFAAAEAWGILDDLLAALGAAEILARGPKSVGALRRRGLQELWAPESEAFEDVLEHLRGRDLTGLRIVVQEHGQSLSMAAHALRRQGADVTTVTVYRVLSADDPEPMFHLIDQIADRELDAVTFTSAPAVAALMEAAGSTGRRDELVGAFQADVVASCVGPVTAAAFEMWGVPSIYPGAVAAGRDGQAARERAARAIHWHLLRRRRPHAAGAERLRRGGLHRRHRGEALARAVRRAPGPDDQPRPRRLPPPAARRPARPAPPARSTRSRWRSPACVLLSAPGSCRPWSSGATGWPWRRRPESSRTSRHPNWRRGSLSADAMRSGLSQR